MITNKTEYLLFTLINLAAREDQDYISSRIVAEEENIPPNYMPQLMAILSKKGWVESARGVNGGVRLSVSPEKISVQDVIELSGDAFCVKKCVEDGCAFGKSRCELNSLWCEAQRKVEEVMKNKTLAELVGNRVII